MYRCRDYRTTWGHITRGYTAVIEQQLYVYMFYETAFAFKQNKTAIRDCRRISSISPWDSSQRSTLRRVGMFVYVNFYLLFFPFGNWFFFKVLTLSYTYVIYIYQTIFLVYLFIYNYVRESLKSKHFYGQSINKQKRKCQMKIYSIINFLSLILFYF